MQFSYSALCWSSTTKRDVNPKGDQFLLPLGTYGNQLVWISRLGLSTKTVHWQTKFLFVYIFLGLGQIMYQLISNSNNVFRIYNILIPLFHHNFLKITIIMDLHKLGVCVYTLPLFRQPLNLHHRRYKLYEPRYRSMNSLFFLIICLYYTRVWPAQLFGTSLSLSACIFKCIVILFHFNLNFTRLFRLIYYLIIIY